MFQIDSKMGVYHFPSSFSFHHYSLPSPQSQDLLLICSVVVAFGAKVDLQSALMHFQYDPLLYFNQNLYSQ